MRYILEKNYRLCDEMMNSTRRIKKVFKSSAADNIVSVETI